MKVKKLYFIMIGLFLFSVSLSFSNIQRFPKPEFESEYQTPGFTTPAGRDLFFQYADAALLVLFLATSSYIILKKRSRKLLFTIMLLSLVYFGFYRKGCICPVGATQNVVASFFDSLYLLPLVAILFFFLPLIAALFSGRSFCGGVCPLGAFQDVLLIKHIKLPRKLTHVLELIPPIYLGTAVLLAATGSAYLICKFDPFVSFFRASGNPGQMIYSIVFAGLCLFIGRPYCRFLCPYGVILKVLSKLSIKHTVITGKTCINCGLCSPSCPVDAIQPASQGAFPGDRKKSVKNTAVITLLLPVFLFTGALAGWNLGNLLSMTNPSVRLIYKINREEHIRQQEGAAERTSVRLEKLIEEIEAFKSSTKSYDQLAEEVKLIRRNFRWGTLILAIYTVVIIWGKLFSLSLYKKRETYRIDKGSCVSCLRCTENCPLNRKAASC